MKDRSEEITNIKYYTSYGFSQIRITCPTNKIKVYYTNKTGSPMMTPQEQVAQPRHLQIELSFLEE